MTAYRVTGVFLTQTTREEITRTVEAPHEAWAISVVDGEALRAGKLFCSAVAVPAIDPAFQAKMDSLVAGSPSTVEG